MEIVGNNQIASNFSIAGEPVEENPAIQSSPLSPVDCLPAGHESSIGLASSVSLTYATNWMASGSMRSD